MMRKCFYTFLTLFTFMGLWLQPAFAQLPVQKNIQENLKQAGQIPYGTPATESADVTAGRFIGSFINFFFGLVGTIAFLLFVYAGFLWLTARGNEKQVEQAKLYLKNAVIGMIIIMLAYSATIFITDLIFKAAVNK